MVLPDPLNRYHALVIDPIWRDSFLSYQKVRHRWPLKALSAFFYEYYFRWVLSSRLFVSRAASWLFSVPIFITCPEVLASWTRKRWYSETQKLWNSGTGEWVLFSTSCDRITFRARNQS